MSRYIGESEELRNSLENKEQKERLLLRGIRVGKSRRNVRLIWTLGEERKKSKRLVQEYERYMIRERTK
jgi:hypothetical protein